jgi:hypothetical protein
MKTSFLLLFLLTSLIIYPQSAKYAEVKSFMGKPALFINGKHVVPDFYALTHAYGGRWSWEEVPAETCRIFARRD